MRPWFTTCRPPVKFRAIWTSFDTPTVNRGTEKASCVLKPNAPPLCPKTHQTLLHVLERSITIAWPKTTPHLDSPSSLYAYLKTPPFSDLPSPRNPKNSSLRRRTCPPPSGRNRRRRPAPIARRHVALVASHRRRPAEPDPGPREPTSPAASFQPRAVRPRRLLQLWWPAPPRRTLAPSPPPAATATAPRPAAASPLPPGRRAARIRPLRRLPASPPARSGRWRAGSAATDPGRRHLLRLRRVRRRLGSRAARNPRSSG